jgi:hypothetical protein
MPRYREEYQNNQRISQIVEELPPEEQRRDEAASELRAALAPIRADLSQITDPATGDLAECEADIAANVAGLTLAQLRQHVERLQRRQRRLLIRQRDQLRRERHALRVADLADDDREV